MGAENRGRLAGALCNRPLKTVTWNVMVQYLSSGLSEGVLLGGELEEVIPEVDPAVCGTRGCRSGRVIASVACFQSAFRKCRSNHLAEFPDVLSFGHSWHLMVDDRNNLPGRDGRERIALRGRGSTHMADCLSDTAAASVSGFWA